MKSGIHFIMFTIIIGIFSLNVAPASIVTDGLVSYWTFDKRHINNDIVKDVWGDNNGKIIGNPKVVLGQVGEALKFDGNSDFVNLTTLGDFGSQLGNSSFEAWIKTNNTTDWMTLVNTHGAECPHWGIQLNGTKSRNEVEIRKGTLYHHISVKGEKSCGSVGRGSTTKIFDGEWHHIVATNNYIIKEGVGGSGGRIVYIDGVAFLRSTHSFRGNRAFMPFTKPVHLGARNFRGITHGYFEGMIDEVRFYDRPLTADEVNQNFESRVGLNVEPNEL